MGARITRPSSGDGAPTLKRSEKILFKVSRGASSIYSTLLSHDAKDALLSDPLVLGVSAGGGDHWLLFP